MSVRGDAPADPAIYQVFTPHRAGLPNLLTYTRELWQRRSFAQEMSRAKMRGSKVNTFFGQAWLLLNPLLQASVYFVMIMIIRGGFSDPEAGKQRFAHLTASIFLFTIARVSLGTGAKSITTSGKVLLNTNFPRLLIPLSAVRTAFFQFLPSIPLYLLIHLATGQIWSPYMLASVYFILTMLVFSMGLAALMATVNVYFRDTGNFLPFLLRLWMYLSPVLWTLEDLDSMLNKTPFPRVAEVLVQLNPAFPMLSGYTSLLQANTWPSTFLWLASAGWAIASVVVGFLFFISRERDFAVRVL